ncbi:MAG: hypothetical protein ACSHX6_02220 [Akkermansiaceae bacterium]
MNDSNTPPTSPSESTSPTPVNLDQSFSQKLQTIQATTKTFFHRFIKSDFQQQELLDSEQTTLDASGIPKESILARNFLAWRRGLLWIAGVSLTIAVIFSLIELVEVIEDKVPGIITFILIMFIIAKIGATYFIAQAALAWSNVKKTKKCTRLGWMSMFVIPFAISMIPVEPFLDTNVMGPQQAMITIAGIGALFLLTLLPMVLGLFPGLIRSSLALKTLIPESPMPGWIAIIIAPLYALFFIIALMIAVQAQSFLAIVALAAYSFAPLTLVMNARKLTSPASAEELDEVLRGARKKLQFYNLIGIVAMIALLLTKVKEWDIATIASFISNFLATVLLVTVATSDILLSLFRAAFNRESELHSSDQLNHLKDQFADLETLGLTDLNVLKEKPQNTES